MKNLLFVLLMGAMIGFSACGDDETPTAPDYVINIVSPTTDDKNVNDDITLNVNVTDSNGGTVHHVNVRIYNKADNTDVLYNGPSEAHVHEEDGDFTLTDNIRLEVDAHSDWIMEVKAWGHEAGAAEKVQSLEFHVHPE